MVQLAQFGLQLFLGHGGGMGWGLSLALDVGRQLLSALADCEYLGTQVEACPILVEDVVCEKAVIRPRRHHETMWVSPVTHVPPLLGRNQPSCFMPAS